MGKIRIHGGQWKKRVIHFSDHCFIRPTPIRLRQTLFDWLGSDLSGCSCLDLFSGSGALGLEALSRGATHVTFVEKDRRATLGMSRTVSSFGVGDHAHIVCQDVMDFLTRLKHDDFFYDIVFLDPPFQDHRLLLETLACLKKKRISQAVVYVEVDQNLDLESEWVVLKTKKVSRVLGFLLRYSDDHEGERSL